MAVARNQHGSVLLFLCITALLLGAVLSERKEQGGLASTQLRKGGKGGAKAGSGGSSPGPSGVKASTTGRTRYSTPRTYAGAGFTPNPTRYSNRPSIRPFYIILLLGPGLGFAGSGYHRQCPDGEFRFGSSCRPCSDQTCPIGQYRIECSPYNDAHCTSCTNKPENGNTRYTTPGNDNDCAWEDCDGPCPVLQTTEEAVIAVDVLVPVSDSEFPAVEEGYREGIASISQVDGTSIFFAERVENTHTATRRAETAEWALVTPARAQRRLFADADLTESNETSTNSTTDGLNLTAIDAWSCSQDIPEHDKFLTVSVEISTTQDQVDALWDRLTAFALAQEMADRCLPPPILQYQEPTSSDTARLLAPRTVPMVLFALLLVMVIPK